MRGLRQTPLGGLLKERKITQTQLAKETGLNRETVNQFVLGRTPKTETLLKIADYLNVSTDFLLGRNAWKQTR